MEAAPGFEPGDKGFAVLCLTAWLCRRSLRFNTLRVNHRSFCDVLCTSACPKLADSTTEGSSTDIAFASRSEFKCAYLSVTVIVE
jgi:hypothetical protein